MIGKKMNWLIVGAAVIEAVCGYACSASTNTAADLQPSALDRGHEQADPNAPQKDRERAHPWAGDGVDSHFPWAGAGGDHGEWHLPWAGAGGGWNHDWAGDGDEHAQAGSGGAWDDSEHGPRGESNRRQPDMFPQRGRDHERRGHAKAGEAAGAGDDDAPAAGSGGGN